MTMLTSLKALLFATPASAGVKTDAMSDAGSTDFAILLNSAGTVPTATAQPIAPTADMADGAGLVKDNVKNQDVEAVAWHPAIAHATPSPASVAVPPQTVKPQTTVQLPVAYPDADRASAPASAAPAAAVEAPDDIVPAHDKAPPTDALPPQRGEGAPTASASPTPVTVAPGAIASAAVDRVPAPVLVKAHPARPRDAVPADPVAISLSADISAAQDAPEPSASEDEAMPVAQDDSQPPPQPIVLGMAQPAPPAASPVVQPDAPPAAAIQANPIQAATPSPSSISRSAPAAASMAQPVSEEPVDSVDHPAPSPTPVTPPRAAAPSPTPVTPPRAAVASHDAAPKPVDATPLPSVAAVPQAGVAPPLPAEAAIARADMPVEQPAIGKPAAAPALDLTRAASQTAPVPPIQNAGPASTASPLAAAAPPSSVAAPIADTLSAMPVATAASAMAEPLETADQSAAIAQASLPVAPTKARAEAVSLLQLVRDHMSLRAPRRTEAAAPVGDGDAAAAPAILPTAPNDSAMPTAALVQPTVQPIATATTAMPTVDLSASLGAQMVDMGVSGQWIDGLARDIAGLSANGAQGRFQINADQLGPIQVDIRQGDDGAAIRLTVATEAAEQALRQEGDRLKLDAGLSAMRISEMKIERAPHVAETTRSDSGGNQSASQQQSGGHGQNAHQATGQTPGQGMGQSSAQSHMQGRGRPRENIAFGHKAGSDAAVLNHTDVGESVGGAVRARYA
ncbi:flagellar hook-length control protein FliK [Sphingobium sp. Z007]|uniref:flagellar hook-length control protein FliK n=1 Tax=Sphingobium sp. Z007 TaxID=627495 RepID=UPI000B49D8B0|nr:flagellar hook-length control protein FliK [Sphingobium sp. Z007]